MRSNYDKKYYEKNKRKIKKYLKNYYQQNKEKIKAKSRARHKIFREEIKKNKKIYCQKNKEKLSLMKRKWKLKNKKKMLDWEKGYNIKKRKEDPNFNMKHRLRSRLNVVLKKYGKRKKFPASKYGIDYEKIINHLKPFPKNIHEFHVDHIKPLCTFDLTDPIQIKKAFAPQNHQWLLACDNLKKGGRLN